MGLSLGAAFAVTGTAQADVITVDTLGDDAPGIDDCQAATDLDCSLRGAIDDSNASAAVTDSIVFKSGLSGDIDLGSELVVSDGVQMDGAGASVAVDGQNAHRVFKVTVADEVFGVSNLTLKDGSAAYGGAIYSFSTGSSVTVAGSTLISNTAAGGRGGAIYTQDDPVIITGSTLDQNTATNPTYGGGAVHTDGSLTVTGSTFDQNSAAAGGAIAASGPTTISGSTFTINHTTGVSGDGGAILFFSGTSNQQTIGGSSFSGNTAGQDGGAIATGGAGNSSLSVTASTLSGNTAGASGGAIHGYHTPLTVTNTTIYDNTAGAGGGGINRFLDSAEDTDKISNSTITANHADAGSGGGVSRFAAAMTPDSEIVGTIVAGNTAMTNADIDGAFDASFSLVQDPTGATLTGASNITGQDPQLGGLQANGGPTLTRAPAATSPALDKGFADGLSTDQRGTGRPFDIVALANAADGADIGAVELVLPASTPPTVTPTPPAAPSTRKKKCKKGRKLRKGKCVKRKRRKKK